MVTSAYIKPVLAIGVSVAVIALSIFVYLSGSRVPAPVQPISPNLPQGVDVVLKKARFSEIENGQIAWVLNAEHVDYNKKGDKANLSGIRMLFQRDNVPDAVTVTADSGEYSSTDKHVRLSGHVHVVTNDGVDFKTNTIVYTGASAMFTTSDRVNFQQEKLHLVAVGMDYNVKTQQSRFFSAVESTIISQ